MSHIKYYLLSNYPYPLILYTVDYSRLTVNHFLCFPLFYDLFLVPVYVILTSSPWHELNINSLFFGCYISPTAT